MEGGFGGSRDSAGRVVAAGWKELGLPVRTGQEDCVAYAAAAAKAGVKPEGV
jgi:hypothetical protein